MRRRVGRSLSLAEGAVATKHAGMAVWAPASTPQAQAIAPGRDPRSSATHVAQRLLGLQSREHNLVLGCTRIG